MGQHALAREFSVDETHGILLRPENDIYASSKGLGWTTAFASTQRERPYEDRFSAVDDHLVIVHLDGPVPVTRLLGRHQARRVIAPGGLFILPGGLDFGVRLEGLLNTLHVYIRKHIVDEVAESFGFDGGGRAEIIPALGDHDILVERLAMGLLEGLREGDSSCPAYADYLAHALAACLLKRHSTSAGRGTLPAGGFSRLQLQRVTDFMEAHLARPITLGEMASATGLSPSHFARRFKIATDMPPHQYLMRLRVDRAKRLLLSAPSIAEVAMACGFTHQEHMTRIFRRLVGTTPANYRRSIQS